MSEEVGVNINANREISNQTLSKEDIKELVEKTLKSGKDEAHYFLRLSSLVNKCHPNGVYRQRYSVVFGEVKEITTYEYSDSCTEEKDIVIIPQSRNVILVTDDGFGKPTRVYIFSFQRGWVSLYL